MTNIPEEFHTDTEAALQHLEDRGLEELAGYLEYLYEDWYDGKLADSGRYFTIEEVPEEGMDISRLLDIAVIFGMVWEREDPWQEIHEQDT